MPQARRSAGFGGPADADKTTAIPVHRPAKPKSDPESTEKLPSQGGKPAQEPEDEQRQRLPRKREVPPGGGVSAQDLLRREGRI
jgi:hypothetical protein